MVTWADDELRLTPVADEYPAVELWQVESNAAPLVEKALGRSVLLDRVAPSKWPDVAR